MTSPNYKVKISANPAEFVKGMKTAKSSLKGFGSSVISVRNAVIGLAGAGGFGFLVKSSLESVDALAKTSDKLGIATEKLAGLRHAAELTGVSAGTMDMALQRMTRRLAEAAQGGGEAKAAIEQLGLDAQKLAAQSPDKSFREIATAMESVDQQSEKVRLAFKFFDSEGVALVNTLALGSKGLNEAGKEAEQLGIAISRIDAAKVEAANDAMTRASAVFKGAGQAAAVELAPFIESAANEFVGIAKDAGGFGEIALNATEGTVLGLSKVSDVARGLHVVWKGLEVIVLGFGSAVTLSINQAVDGWRQIGNLIPGIDLEPIQFLQDATTNSVQSLIAAKQELASLVTQEMPSEGVREFFSAIREGADTAAISITNLRGGGEGGSEKGGTIPGVLGLTDEDLANEILAVNKHYKRLEIERQKAADRAVTIELQKAQMIISSIGSTASAASGFINALPGEHKKAARIIFAVEKGLAIAQTVINTEVAAIAALKLDPTGSLSTYVRGLGYTSVGLIAGTALLGGETTGGGSSSGGVAPQNLDPVRDIGDGINPGGDENRGGSTQIIIQGNVIGQDDYVFDTLIPAIVDAVDNKEIVLVSPNSRNGLELST